MSTTLLGIHYTYALENMNDWTWEQCCTEALAELNRLGIKCATNHETVARWNILLRCNNGRFPLPASATRSSALPD